MGAAGPGITNLKICIQLKRFFTRYKVRALKAAEQPFFAGSQVVTYGLGGKRIGHQQSVNSVIRISWGQMDSMEENTHLLRRLRTRLKDSGAQVSMGAGT